MSQRILLVPEEPRTLLAEIQAQLEQSPADGLRLIDSTDWMADVLWPVWCEYLDDAGIGRAEFQRIVSSYRNELRLWVMGERPWVHCIEGLVGRVERRMEVSAM